MRICKTNGHPLKKTQKKIYKLRRFWVRPRTKGGRGSKEEHEQREGAGMGRRLKKGEGVWGNRTSCVILLISLSLCERRRGLGSGMG